MLSNIAHDGTLDIATGRSRKEMSWKNKEVLWSELITKLSTTHRTAETHSEYLVSKKLRQDEIKDIGGFVGGYLSGGRRKSGAVMHRQLLTLDMDYAAPGFWDEFTMIYGHTACLYSTHKHSPDTPRLRLIMPLDRSVITDEYIAISRRIAGNIGINLFDPTTYQPERLMYWPSTSRDGDYEFHYQDGPWLNADEVLSSYRDWRDASEWPVADREHSIVHRAIKKQGDPLEKPGVIGAFCRTYTITQAIETFLADVYDTCDTDGRYTYKEGSTAAGLVVYEDKYAFSHHGTDPVSRKLCNAFDLVRLHKYGLRDEDAREGTPNNKMPSYTEMIGFAAQDPKVRKQLGSEILEKARGDFNDFTEPQDQSDQPGNDEWLSQMDVDRKGKYYSTVNNILLLLKNDPKIKDRFALDTFEHREIATRNLPWRKISRNTRYLTDKDDAGIRYYIEKIYDITGIQKISDGLDMLLMERSFHPVKDYLQALKWDGKQRADSLLIDYLGATDNAYTRAVTRKSIVAAVTRVFKPGVKFDNILTLVGMQGIGKSTLLNKLGRSWFSDSFSFHMVGKKEANEQLQGVWILEIGELAGMRKADLESIKHFISKRDDRYRVAFGKRVENFPRQCVFFATSNNRDFLRDGTGNRRFWIVDMYEQEPVKNIFREFTDYEIDQVWAEAVELYNNKELLYLDAETEAFAMQVQEEHTEADERTGMVQKYLDTLVPENWDEMGLYERRSFLQNDDEIREKGTLERDRICVAEIWCELLGGTVKDMTSQNTKYIHDIMRKLIAWRSYKSRTVFRNYGNQRGYFREEKKYYRSGQKQ